MQTFIGQFYVKEKIFALGSKILFTELGISAPYFLWW